MAHVELPQEELQPLIESMKMVFEPFLNVLPDIAKIPSEVDRLINVISQDINSGQGERFEDGSKKSVDMIQMMKDFNERNSEEGKKRQKEREELERIAQERQKAEADLKQLQQLGTSAEITEDNKIKILNEKEIIEKQKEYIKEQKEVTFLEKQIEEEKGKGEDADSERLIMLKEALDKQNELVQEQANILGDRLPVKKFKEDEPGLGARDFIPDPLMEVFTTVGEQLRMTKDTLLSFTKPFTGVFKLFTSIFKKKKSEEEEFIEQLEDRGKKEKKTAKEVAQTTLKMIGLSIAVVSTIAALYALGKAIMKIPGVEYLSQDENLQRERGLVFQETNQEYFDRLVDKEGKTPDEAREIVDSDVFNFLGNMTDTAPMDLKHSSELAQEQLGSITEGMGGISVSNAMSGTTREQSIDIIKEFGDKKTIDGQMSPVNMYTTRFGDNNQIAVESGVASAGNALNVVVNAV